MHGDGSRVRERRVRLHTWSGVLEGYMPCSPAVRTLDAVNQLATGFVTLQPPVTTPFGAPFGEGPVAISRSSVVLIEELEESHAQAPVLRAGFPKLWRAAIVLRVGTFTVNGFVHVPMGGNPLMRVSTNDGPPFLALTVVDALSPTGPVKAQFVAVNRSHITAAQEVLDGDEFANDDAAANADGTKAP
jgi:hypothetical protein